MTDNKSQSMRDIEAHIHIEFEEPVPYGRTDSDLANIASFLVALVIVGGGLWAFLNFIGRAAS